MDIVDNFWKFLVKLNLLVPDFNISNQYECGDKSIKKLLHLFILFIYLLN